MTYCNNKYYNLKIKKKLYLHGLLFDCLFFSINVIQKSENYNEKNRFCQN